MTAATPTGETGPGTPEQRRQYIGASEVAAIMGLSKWATPLQVWERKTGRSERPIEDPAKIKLYKRGKRWEQPAFEMLCDELDERGHKVELFGANNRFDDDEFNFLSCEIDREIILDGELVNVEIKTVHALASGEWGEMDTDEVPIYYATQAMMGLSITKRRLCLVGCLIGADSMTPYFVERDEETIAGMRATCVKFWYDNVVADKAPDPINMDDMMRLFARKNGRPAYIDAETYDALTDLARCRSQLQTFGEAEEELKFRVCDGIRRAWDLAPADEPEDNAVIRFNGKDCGSWKKQSRVTIDSKFLKALYPKIAEECSKESTTRVLRIKL